MAHSFPTHTPKLMVSVTDSVATVAINNPGKRNALDLPMWKALPPVMAALDGDPDVRIVILRGAGDRRS